MKNKNEIARYENFIRESFSIKYREYTNLFGSVVLKTGNIDIISASEVKNEDALKFVFTTRTGVSVGLFKTVYRCKKYEIIIREDEDNKLCISHWALLEKYEEKFYGI